VRRAIAARDPQAIIGALAGLDRLAAFASGSIVEQWLPWIDSADAQIRRRAAGLLTKTRVVPGSASGRLLARLHAESDTEARSSLFEVLVGLGPLPEIVAGLTDLVRDSRWAVRRLAAKALGELGPAAVVAAPALRELASGAELSLSEEALAALAKIQPASDLVTGTPAPAPRDADEA
jgi:HEAT repeat protein